MTLLLDNWQKITAKIRTCLERSLTDRIFANQTTFFGEGLYTNIRILNGHFQNSEETNNSVFEYYSNNIRIITIRIRIRPFFQNE